MRKFLWVIVGLLISAEAFGADEITCPSGSPSGAMCWKCGNTATDCTATYSDGTLTINGTGQMKGYSYTRPNNGFLTTAPWKDKIEDITKLEVNGVSNVGNFAFVGLKNVSAVDISNSVTSLGQGSLHSLSSLSDLYIPTSINSVGSYAFDCLPHTKIYVKDSLVSTVKNSGINAAHATEVLGYKQENGLIYVYDQGQVVAMYENEEDMKNSILSNTKKSVQVDENGNMTLLAHDGQILGKYDKDGNMLESYIYNDDGSKYVYDKDGKLLSVTGKRIFTVDEATALVSGKNRFTIRYR